MVDQKPGGASTRERIAANLKRFRPFWLRFATVSTLLGLPDTLAQAGVLAGPLGDIPGQSLQSLFLVVGLSLLVLLLIVPPVRSLLVERLGLPASQASVVVGAGFALFVGLGCIGLFRGSSTAEGEAPVTVLRPVDVPSQIGSECEALDPAKEEHHLLRRAVSYVSCEPVGAGADGLTFANFRSNSDLADWLEEWRDHLNVGQGPCARSEGYVPWADSEGKPEGNLVCGAQDGISILVWTDESERQLATINSTERFASNEWLYSWWTHHVRQFPRFPDPNDRRLLRIARLSLRVRGCHRNSTIPASAIASIVCEDPEWKAGGRFGSDSIVLGLYPNESSLTAYFDTYADMFARFAGSEERCRDSVLARGTWRLGEFACFPASGEEWLAWTNERRKIIGLIGRADEDLPELYDAWANLAF